MVDIYDDIPSLCCRRYSTPIVSSIYTYVCIRWLGQRRGSRALAGQSRSQSPRYPCPAKRYEIGKVSATFVSIHEVRTVPFARSARTRGTRLICSPQIALHKSRTSGRLCSRSQKRKKVCEIQQQNVSRLHGDFYVKILVVARGSPTFNVRKSLTK